MKYNVLHTFISPITGRIVLSPEDYTLVGDSQGVGSPSPILIDIRLDIINLRYNINTIEKASFVIGFPNIKLPNAQILKNMDDGFMFNTAGIVSTKAKIPIGALPDLGEGNIWLGDGEDPSRPQEEHVFNYDEPAEHWRIIIDYFPNLTHNKVWVGDENNRPIERDYPSSGAAPADASYILQTPNVDLPNSQALSDLFILPIGPSEILMSSPAGVVSLATANVDYATPGYVDTAVANAIATAAAYTDAVALITLASAATYTDTVAAVTLAASIAYTDSSISDLRLNNIPVDGNISLYNSDTGLNYRIIDAADPLDPQDLATKIYVDTVAGGIPGTVFIELIGAISGSGYSTSPISTTLNTTLDAVPTPVGDVNLAGFRIKALDSPISATDAANRDYVDTAVGGIATSVVLTGGVTGSGFTGTPISTTVAVVSPSAIVGYPSNTTTFLRGDGTWTNILGGSLGLEGTTPHAPLQFSNTLANRKIVLFESANNDNQVRGFGTATNILKYQVEASTVDHIFYAGASSTTSTELFRVTGTGIVTVPTTGQLSVLSTTNSTSATVGSAVFAGGIGISGQLYTVNNIRLADTNIYFRGATDVNHGIGWYGNTKLFAGVNVDGSVIFGNSGGVLGLPSTRILTWGSTGVSIIPSTASVSTSTGALVCAGGAGIAGTLNANVVAVSNGTVSVPSYTFTNNTNTGLYRIAANNIGISCGGVKIIDIQSSATIFSSTNFGLEGTTPHAPLQFSNTLASRKIVLFESANNDNQVRGFGTATNILKYQVEASTVDHIFYAGTSSTTSIILGKIKGTGGWDNASNKITSIGTPTAPDDGANKGYVDSVVSGIPLSISLIGDINGSGSTGSPITTTLVLTLNQIPLATADVNLNTNKIINVVDPTSAQHAATKNYVDNRSITLSGGVIGSGTLATGAISTTVAVVSPSAIVGYPSNTTTFLRGDGTWTNNLSGNVGIGTSTTPVRLCILGTDNSYNNGPHIEFRTTYDSYPLFQIFAYNHDGVFLNFDSYFDGAHWVSGSSTANFQIAKAYNALYFNFAAGVAAGSNISGWTPSITMGNNGNIGIKLAGGFPNSPLQFTNTIMLRVITLYEVNNNSVEFRGFGTGLNSLNYQVENSSASHIFYAGASSTLSTTLATIKGTGGLDNAGFELTNMGTPSTGTSGANKTYVDTAVGGVATSVVLTGGVTASGFTGTPISTTVAVVPPSAIVGYPSNTTTFLRGDGTWTNILGGSLGLEGTTPHVPLQFSNTLASRKIVLLESANNDNQVRGFGTATNILKYQVEASTVSHIFYAGASSTLSTTLATIKGTGGLDNAGFELTNMGTPSTGTSGANKTYVDTAVGGIATSVVLTGGVTASGFTGTPISTTVAVVPPSAIVGYPSDTTMLLRGDGTWTNILGGSLGLEGTTPNAALQLSNTVVNRKIVLYDSASPANDHQFYGFGVNSGTLRYQVNNATGRHVFYAAASSTTSTELMRITGTGVGIGTTSTNALLQFSNTLANRKIVLLETANNDNQVMGFGTATNTLVYQINASTSSHVFYAGASSTTSTELFRVTGTGIVTIPTTGQLSVLSTTDSTSATVGSAVFAGGIGISGQLYTVNNIRLADTNIYFRGGTDVNHGIGWYGSTKLFAGINVDGSVVFGNSGGVLGLPSTRILAWSSTGVSIIPTTVSLSTSTGALVCAGGAGIAGTLNANVVAVSDGTVNTPSITFTSDSLAGLYRIGAGNIGVCCSNVQVLNIKSSSVACLPPFSVGRLKGSVGASSLEIYGTVSNVSGPHIQCITSEDNNPNFQLLGWAHNNIALSLDAYYDGTNWKSSNSGSNYQIIKLSNQLQFNYSTGITAGSNISWLTSILINTSGNVGIKTTPSYALDVGGTFRTQKLLGNGSTPSVSAGAAAGTSPTLSIAGTELSGLFSVQTVSGATSGTIATFTIAAMPTTNYGVVITPANSLTASSNLQTFITVTSTTAFTLSTANVLANSSLYRWNFHIIG